MVETAAQAQVDSSPAIPVLVEGRVEILKQVHPQVVSKAKQIAKTKHLTKPVSIS